MRTEIIDNIPHIMFEQAFDVPLSVPSRSSLYVRYGQVGHAVSQCVNPLYELCKHFGQIESWTGYIRLTSMLRLLVQSMPISRPISQAKNKVAKL